MKTKITSLILVLALFVSLFSMYSFASEAVEETTARSSEGYTNTYLHYLNTFGDSNEDYGGTLSMINATDSTYELKAEANGNKYGYYNFNDSGSNVYMQLEISQAKSIGTGALGYLVFEFDFNDFGAAVTTNKFFEVHSGSGSISTSGRQAASDILNVANDSNGNYFYFNNSKTNKIYINSNEWVHIRCEFSVLSSSATKYNLRCYIGDQYFESTFKLGNPKYISFLRFGSTKSTNQKFGFDNIALYSSRENLASYSDAKAEMASLTMKVGAENASLNSTQIELQHVPMLIDGQIFCPVYIIEELTGKECPDQHIVLIEDVEYIHIDSIYDAFGIAAESYDMGLILIGKKENMLDDDASYEEMIDVMKEFIFNLPSSSQLISDVNANTNGFDHPYLLANSDRFAELRSIYNKGKNSLANEQEKLLYDYISTYISGAESQYSTYCGNKVTETYNGLKADKIPVNANYSKYNNNGYDNGGRVSVPTGPLLYFAFAYQITKNLNYARAAYDYMLALGDWNHWGPGHFLNCADTSAPFSIAYDWMYDAFVELNQKGEVSKYDSDVYETTKLATILFTHVIIPGYIQSNNISCPWPGTVDSRYATKTNNWNAVCTSGVVMAALLLLNEDIPTAGMTFNTQKKSGSNFTQTVTKIEEIGSKAIHVGLSTYSDYAAKLASMNLQTLVKHGLGQYAPDGSYVESPGYWSYGTNTFFRLAACLVSAAGDDYGLMDTWGLDSTCYFAIHSESSDYNTWNFNDGSVGVQDSSFFFFVGDFYGDDNLIRVRKTQLVNGKSISLYDLLFYDTTVVGEPQLSKDYLMVGIDAYAVRSSWDKGAIFAGLIGGANNVSHGQMDAGAFVYHNNGKIWFHDLGTDNYNYTGTGGYFSNYRLYRIGSEGHNLITLTSQQKSLPYGQLTNANPKITQTYSSDDGAYAVLDLSETYGTYVKSAQRGMLFTDSRNTVVIQDEFVFNGKQTAYWFGHYQIATGYVDEVVVSADGRTAFMLSGEDMIRVSIVSDNKNLKFEIMDCYTYVLDITNDTDRNTMDGAGTEYNRDNFRKLAIKCENVETLNLAVVIESVDTYEAGTSYEWTPIDEWTVESKEFDGLDSKFKADFESSSVGSYELSSANNAYVLKHFATTNGSYLGILPNASGTSSSTSSLKLLFKNNTSLKLDTYRFMVADFDLYADGSFIDETAFGINVKNSDDTVTFIPLVEFVGRNVLAGGYFTALSTSWKHLTVIVDTVDGCAYVYADGKKLSKINNVFGKNDVSVINFEFNLPNASANDFTSSIMLDNIVIRAFHHYYSANELEGILQDGTSISSWSDATAYETIQLPLAVANGVYLYNNSELEEKLKNGITVTLLRDTNSLVSINGPANVNTNGYDFKYVSDNYFGVVKGNVITFSKDNVKVTWHVGDEIFEEIYTGASIAEFKLQSYKIGTITYSITDYANGGRICQFYTTGWSNIPLGAALSKEEMIVSKDNCEFWLVNNVPLDCLFATVDDNGVVTPYYDEQSLRTLIASDIGCKEIYLCNDVEIKNTGALNLSRIGKKVYLNGYTLSHRQTDVHMFYFNTGASADFEFVGPGTLEADTSRTMFTSYASETGLTSVYGVVVRNADIIVNPQLADLRTGNHRFINCRIYHSSGKSLMALWNKNPNVNNGVPANLLKFTFSGCVVESKDLVKNPLVSFTSNGYAELYIIDTSIISSCPLFESGNTSVKIDISGESSLKASIIVTNTTANYSNVHVGNGVATNIELPAKYMPEGAVLTSNYNASLPYLVSQSYATVLWKDLNGNTIYEELVSVGVTPKINATAVLKYLKQLNNAYTYEVEKVDSTDQVVFTPIAKTEVTILQSMYIQDDLSMYLYIDKDEMDTQINFIRVNGTKIMPSSYEVVVLNGKSYYKYKISSFTPSNACDDVLVSVERLDGGIQQFTISAVDYLESLLAISSSDSEKILAVKLLKYIQSAYAYFKSSKIAEYNRLDSIIEEYRAYDPVFATLKSETSATGALKDCIQSARMNLSASARIRFMLNPEFTGVLEITFNGETTNYYIVDGMVNGCAYVEVVMPATLVNESIVLTASGNSATYGLSAYATAMNNSNRALHQMLMCLSEYSAAAKEYVNG